MRIAPRNDAFARCTAERYASCEDAPEVEIPKPDKPVEQWTAAEMHEYCKARKDLGGDSCGGGDCPLYYMCAVYPDEWDFLEKPQFTDQELKFLGTLRAAGTEEIGRTGFGTLWHRKAGCADKHTLPDGLFPSIRKHQVVNIRREDLQCLSEV